MTCLRFICIYIIYSQTCLNDHLYETTTRLRRPTLSLPKQIPIQSLLYKTTICLTRPATTFFISQMKIYLSKTTTTKFYTVKKWGTNIRQQPKKIKRFFDYIYYLLYCYFITQQLCNVYKNWTILTLYEIM